MFEYITRLIEARLRSEWPSNGAKIAWDNVEFTPKRGVPFIRLQTEIVDTIPISIGGLDRVYGFIQVSIFYPTDKATSSIMAGADQISNIIGRWTKDRFRTGPCRVSRVGEKDQFFQVNVIADFEYDNCST